MLHQDRLVFALLLARIYLKSAPSEQAMDAEFQVLILLQIYSIFKINGKRFFSIGTNYFPNSVVLNPNHSIIGGGGRFNTCCTKITLQILLRGGEKSAATPASVEGLSPEQSVAVHRLATTLPAFKELLKACQNPGIDG